MINAVPRLLVLALALLAGCAAPARASLPLRGMGYGAVAEGRLYLMIYSAPQQHFFAKHLPAAEAAARSARIVGYRVD